jgi:hypothetical protein
MSFANSFNLKTSKQFIYHKTDLLHSFYSIVCSFSIAICSLKKSNFAMFY